MAGTDQTIEQAQQMLARMAQELALVRSENRRLRAQVDTRHSYHATTSPRVLRKAQDNAIAYLVLQSSGFKLTREFMLSSGWSASSYYWAIALLKAARVMDSKMGSREILLDDFVTAEQRVICKVADLIDRPNALAILRLYMPKNLAYAYQARKTIK